ncbi:MAG: AraC family transcriptional regulator [Turicibacter sp.]
MIFFKPKTDYPSLDLMLYNCGTGDCDCNRHWGPGIKDHYCLYYVHSGSGHLKLGNSIYQIKKGDCFLVPPKIIVSYESDCDNEWDYFWVSFNGLSTDSYLNRLNLTANSPVMTDINAIKVHDCFNMIFDSINHKKSMDFHALSGFYLLLSTLAQTVVPNKTVCLSSKQELYIRQAIEFIETNYSRKISVEEISDYVGINRKYLSRLFNELLNATPQNYLINYRIQKACGLLIETNLSIQEISFSVGYSDSLVFSKMFKKFNGVSPKQFRKNQIL